jgi:hypothetical protein
MNNDQETTDRDFRSLSLHFLDSPSFPTELSSFRMDSIMYQLLSFQPSRKTRPSDPTDFTQRRADASLGG